MTDWRQSRVAAGLIILVFVVVQLAIPLSRLGSNGPQRFAWQMFSKATQNREFVVTTDHGETEVVLADYLAMARGDIDLTVYLPEHLCSVIEGAESVAWPGGSLQC